MKSNITKKLILYFTTILLTFAIIIGILFTVIFANNMTNHNKSDLKQRAERIASTLSDFLENTSSVSKGKGHNGMGNNHGGFNAFLNFTDDIAMGEVWLVDKNLDLISKNSHNSNVTYDNLPSDADTLIKKALNGETGLSESFSDIVGEKTITVCVPAFDSNNNVIAAVLLHAPVEGVNASIANGLLILVVSVLIALALSLFVAIILSKHFINPIKSLNTSAKAIALGNYDEKIHVRQNDEIGELASTMNDLSRKLSVAKNKQELLEQEQQNFYSDISHELRTPITVIRGTLEMLKDNKFLDESKKQMYYEQLIIETEYMKKMINDLLDFSKLKNSDYILEKTPLNIIDVLSDATRSMRRVADEKNIEIQLNNNLSSLNLEGNYEKLRQMFLIVIHNAIKFSPKNDFISISVNNEYDKYKISISDNGIGIDLKDMPNIFNRFYKSDSNTNKEGTGIGLAIAYQIAKRHDIEIKVNNIKGHGACFEFILDSAN
ncbi:cell wall metabolism sensor histidine kinase WalK [Peptostreptococcaceae bacterium OttesenSCG-928-C18]|nr:cell wall metabolism sensor histidine kinase WalK [Peptostreptococcaceae bacterium OttesenSCG-928-C18]